MNEICLPAKVVDSMYPTLVDICLRAYPDVLMGDPERVPQVVTKGALDLTFAFIQEHLQFVLQEPVLASGFVVLCLFIVFAARAGGGSGESP